MSRIEALNKALSAATTIKDNTVVIENSEKIFNDNLPKGVTLEAVQELGSYRSDFSVALTQVAGKAIVAHLNENKDVGNMSAEVKTADVDFGLRVARPTPKKGGKVTPELVDAGIAIYTTVKTDAEAISAARKEMLSLWDF